MREGKGGWGEKEVKGDDQDEVLKDKRLEGDRIMLKR